MTSDAAAVEGFAEASAAPDQNAEEQTQMSKEEAIAKSREWMMTYTKPMFLGQYGLEGRLLTHNSFVGRADPLGGKYHIPRHSFRKFFKASLTVAPVH